MIGIINYGSGNVHAIATLHNRAGIPYILSDNPEELSVAEKLILPGVGAFDETMQMLRRNKLFDFANEQVLVHKKPIIGVCVGMQILGESSNEGIEKGFGWIKGHIKKLDASQLSHKPHLPHLGWNNILPIKQHALLQNLDMETGFYFLHSYYFDTTNHEYVLATSDYGKPFACAINHDNVYGVQFHPEKSHDNGIQLFRNFANL